MLIFFFATETACFSPQLLDFHIRDFHALLFIFVSESFAWSQYKNIFRLLDEIGASSALTDWKQSSLYSRSGVEVDSPVFQTKPRLPTPLGQFVHTLPTFAHLPVADRLSLWRLAPAIAAYQRDYARYDGLSAAELLRPVSPRLYRDFLAPLLLATLFAPPEALSAAVTVGAFDFLALGTQANFDVRWCRGAIADRIMAPLAAAVRRRGGAVLAGRGVTGIRLSPDGRRVAAVLAAPTAPGAAAAAAAAPAPGAAAEEFPADAVVLAVGVRGLQRLLAQVPPPPASRQRHGGGAQWRRERARRECQRAAAGRRREGRRRAAWPRGGRTEGAESSRRAGRRIRDPPHPPPFPFPFPAPPPQLPPLTLGR
jgi:hypothetical protein